MTGDRRTGDLLVSRCSLHAHIITSLWMLDVRLSTTSCPSSQRTVQYRESRLCTGMTCTHLASLAWISPPHCCGRPAYVLRCTGVSCLSRQRSEETLDTWSTSTLLGLMVNEESLLKLFGQQTRCKLTEGRTRVLDGVRVVASIPSPGRPTSCGPICHRGSIGRLDGLPSQRS